MADATSAFFVLLAAWLAYAARRSNVAFMVACLAMSLAIGVRQANISLVVLLAFPLAYRYVAAKEVPWKVGAVGAALFLVASAGWLLPAVFFGTGGFPEYYDAVQRQWSNAVQVYDVTHLESPWVPNLLYRLERFFSGYFVTYPWTGGDSKTATSLLLAAPWHFGFALFVTGFRFRDPLHLFLALWLLALTLPVLTIHFLPRYGLPYLPGFIIACLLGYRFLMSHLRSHRRPWEVLSLAGLGSILLLYAIKYQPPVNSFESSPPPIEPYVAALILAGGISLFLGWFLARRDPPTHVEDFAPDHPSSKVLFRSLDSRLLLPLLALLIVPYAIQGYSDASVAHRVPSPAQRLVTFAMTNFEAGKVTPCWDNQTHSFFEASTPALVPLGLRDIGELYQAYDAGRILVVSDRCKWFQELDDVLGLSEIAHFQGVSPLWSKSPSLHLYSTTLPQR